MEEDFNFNLSIFSFFKSPRTLQSVRRHSAIVFVDHKHWRVGDISSDISPI